MSAPRLAIVECRGCGAAWWDEAAIAERIGGVIEAGPCCFGHEVLDVERYATERQARAAWPAWHKRRVERLQTAARRARAEIEQGGADGDGRDRR